MKKITSYTLSVTLLFCAAHLNLYAQQEKHEVEKSIKSEEMPAPALSLIKEFWKEPKKADFYREFDGENISYEVKLDWKGYQYSIEFDEEGLLMDIEQLIEFNEIPEALRNTITEKIDQQYTKYRITRVQRQFTAEDSDEGDAEVIELFLKRNFEDLTIRYELEVDAQNKKEMGSFELLFNNNGQLIQKRKIVRRSLDNIW